jgi:hypothetical protein
MCWTLKCNKVLKVLAPNLLNRPTQKMLLNFFYKYKSIADECTYVRSDKT